MKLILSYSQIPQLAGLEKKEAKRRFADAISIAQRRPRVRRSRLAAGIGCAIGSLFHGPIGAGLGAGCGGLYYSLVLLNEAAEILASSHEA